MGIQRFSLFYMGWGALAGYQFHRRMGRERETELILSWGGGLFASYDGGREGNLCYTGWMGKKEEKFVWVSGEGEPCCFKGWRERESSLTSYVHCTYLHRCSPLSPWLDLERGQREGEREQFHKLCPLHIPPQVLWETEGEGERAIESPMFAVMNDSNSFQRK